MSAFSTINRRMCGRPQGLLIGAVTRVPVAFASPEAGHPLKSAAGPSEQSLGHSLAKAGDNSVAIRR